MLHEYFLEYVTNKKNIDIIRGSSKWLKIICFQFLFFYKTPLKESISSIEVFKRVNVLKLLLFFSIFKIIFKKLSVIFRIEETWTLLTFLQKNSPLTSGFLEHELPVHKEFS